MTEKLKIYVELLDEGTPTLRPAFALPLENNLYKLVEDKTYDPEDEAWDFAPGSLIRLEERVNGNETILVAIHPNPNAIRIYVESAEKFAPPMRATYALPLANELYEVLPTPHYTTDQLWKFPPGSIVRLKSMDTAYTGWKPLIAAPV